MSKIVKNYIFTVLYRVSSIVIPLITMPYITRVLDSEGFGIYAFTNSVIHYFLLFGSLGIGLYGVRAIAYVQDDMQKRSQAFWSIFSLQIFTTTLSLVAFGIFLFFVDSKYMLIYLIQSLFIISSIIDVSWFFQGIEDFQKIAVRDFMIKVLSVACYFIFVKTTEHVWLYTLIVSVANLLRLVVLWIYIPRNIKLHRVTIQSIWAHFVPNLKLFIPQIAIYLYQLLDKTMIGIFVNTSEVGLYEMSQRIIRITFGVISSFGLVMIPRISNLFAKGDMDSIKSYAVKSFKFLNFISFPLAFGIVATTPYFVPWLFGKGFHDTIPLIIIISPIIILTSWGNVVGTQLLLPLKKERKYTISIFIGAILNVTLNLILIPKWHAMGASIASVAAKTVTMGIQFYFARKILPFFKSVTKLWKFVLSSIIMFGVVLAIGYWMKLTIKDDYPGTLFLKETLKWESERILILPGILTTVVQVISGAVIYLLMLWILRCDELFYLFSKVKGYINRKSGNKSDIHSK